MTVILRLGASNTFCRNAPASTDSDVHLMNMNSGPHCNIQKALWRAKETHCCKICICVVIWYKQGIKKTLC